MGAAAEAFNNEPRARRSPVPAAVGGYLGDLVAWRFDNFSKERRAVVALFSDLGFQAAFEHDLSEPRRALAESFREGIDYGRFLVARPLERPNKDTPYALGVYLRVRKDGEGGDDFVCGARVRLDANGVAVALPPDGKDPEADCLECAEQIAARANRLRERVESTELSHAMLSVGYKLAWAKFRSTGGVYWVPACNAPRMRELFDALEKLGGFTATVQPLFGDDAGRTMRNVGGAASAAIAEQIAELEKELEKAKIGKVGKRGLASRVADCQTVLIQAGLYREVLAGELATIEQTLAGIGAEFKQVIAGLDRDDAFQMETE